MNSSNIKPGITLWPKRIVAVVGLMFSVAATGQIAQSPLFLTTNVKPNILIMLDNSGSMNDSLTLTSSGTDYDPTITYLADKNCSSYALPSVETTTQVDTSITNRDDCNAVNGSWSSHRNSCRVQVTTTITYSATIPTNFVGYKTRRSLGTDCFDSNLNYTTSLHLPASVTTSEQTANYLNYYYSNELSKTTTTSTRMEVAKDAATTLVNALPDTVRIGLCTFNSTSSNSLDGGRLVEAVGDFTASKKTTILNQISSFSTSGYTPLSETLADIGSYFATGPSGNVTLRAGTASSSTASKSSVFQSHTLANSSSAAAPIQYSCQKSYTIFLTDGLPTRDQNVSSTFQDYDGDCTGDKATTNGCTGDHDMKDAYPYPGGNGGTPPKSIGAGNESSDYLDDVAKALYEMDLRPDLRDPAKESPTAKNNLTTFLIGFADSSINPDIAGNNPLPRDAALQGGGKFYYASNAYELSASLANAVSIIAEDASSSSSVATNSTQYQTDALLYQALFDSNNWSGNIKGYSIETEDTNGNGRLDSTEDSNQNGILDLGEDQNGNGILDSPEDLNHNGKLDTGAIGDVVWNANEKLATIAATDRNIITYDPQASTPTGIPFLWANLNATQQTVLQSEDVVNYLRGDRSKEEANGGTFRNRASALGDVVNSDPFYVGRDDFGYANLPENSLASYTSFAKTARREMLYVAANDGMLHGFDASTNFNGGSEIFAYLPNAAITSNLVTLTSPTYSHVYLNDGSAQAGDAFFNGGWHTVLVGELGAGGKALYALNVTDPDSFGSSDVLWEFTESDLGYAMAQASVVRTATGTNQWAAIFGNGYLSANGKAVLYVVNIQTGAVIKKIEAGTTGGNGLSSPVAVDVDGDLIVDYVYAGDLKGNLWKFDISSSNTADWGVAYGGSPLFTAYDRDGTSSQPITAKPAVIKAEGTDQTSGTMVYFGTGKYFEVDDSTVPADPQIQSFYGIWDKCDKSSAAGCNGVVSGRDQLQQQSIIYETSNGTTLADGSTISGNVRVVSACEVAYGTTAPTTTTSPCTANTARLGWYLDFIQPGAAAGEGERVVSNAVVRNGVVIFPTLIPTNLTCSPGGTSWLMELDLFSGARIPAGTPVDLNNDGVVDDKDLVKVGDTAMAAAGFKSTVGIIDTPAIISCENGLDCKYASGSSGEMMMKKEKAPTSGTPTPTTTKIGARRSWQQLR